MKKSKTGKRAKHKKDHHEVNAASAAPGERDAETEAEASPSGKMKRKEYEREMRILQGELVAMQQWVTASGAKPAR